MKKKQAYLQTTLKDPDVSKKQEKEQHYLGLKHIQNLKLSQVNPQKYILQDFSDQHEKFLCYIKCKIKLDGKQKVNVKGSGILIDKNYVLTAAHNVIEYKKKLAKFYQIKKNNYQDLSYVKQGLINHKYLCQYKIKSIFISENFLQFHESKPKEEDKKSSSYDYALIQVQPFQAYHNFSLEQEYPLCIGLQEKFAQKIKNIKIYGYPLQSNKKEYTLQKQMKALKMSVQAQINSQYKANDNKIQLEGDDQDYLNDSQSIIGNAYGVSGKHSTFSHYNIKYQLPTQQGISGGPIIGEIGKKKYVIGLHKGKKRENAEIVHNNKARKEDIKQFNMGVCCNLMMNQINKLGHQLKERPFIYSQKTLSLRNKIDKIKKKYLLNKQDRQYQPKDIKVILSYDLSQLTRIYLSGNKLGTEGFICLTEREYPNIESIYLNSNQIHNLLDVKEKNWENIKNVRTISFSQNFLKQLPKQFIILKKLSKLWIPYNPFEVMPQVLLNLAKQNPQKNRKFYMYVTKMFKYQHKKEEDDYNNKIIQQFKKTKTMLILEQPQNLAELGQEQI